jgi:phage terminase large subunit
MADKPPSDPTSGPSREPAQRPAKKSPRKSSAKSGVGSSVSVAAQPTQKSRASGNGGSPKSPASTRRQILLPNNWKPRWYQLPSWCAWEQGCKRELLIWHRRAGKDDVALHKAAVAAHLRPANYWHCLPSYEQARKAIWEAVNPHSGKKRIDEAFPREIRSHTRNDTMTIEFRCGSVWRVVGSDNPDSLVGAPPAGIVFSEFARANPTAWGLLAPILNENKGWASFITTPVGRNHLYGLYQEVRGDRWSPANPRGWYAEVLTVDQTKFISREQIEDDRRTYRGLFGAEAADALILQEYWCSFEASILGAYWGRALAELEQQGRIRHVPHERSYPVNTAWDLGVGKDGGMAIWWWQALGSEIRVLDFYEAHNYGIGHYAELIKRKAKERGWTMGTDYVPHDARVKEMSAFGTAEMECLTCNGKKIVRGGVPCPTCGGEGRLIAENVAKQRVEVMIECGLRPKVTLQVAKKQDGISAVHQILPRVWFDDNEGNGRGLESLRQYRTEWDDETKKFTDKPRHDWTSHGADAFQTMALGYRTMLPADMPVIRGGDIAVAAGGGIPDVTLDELWDSVDPRESARV